MRWSTVLVLAIAGSTGAAEVAHEAEDVAFSSYTKAWNTAHDAERPMLVILNPAQGEGIQEDQLRADGRLQPLLDDYVVAVIDTGSEHGQKVHELFGSPALPRVVVIDKMQKQQVYRTSGHVSFNRLADVLKRHKDGLATQPVMNYLPPANSNCPSCQRGWTF